MSIGIKNKFLFCIKYMKFYAFLPYPMAKNIFGQSWLTLFRVNMFRLVYIFYFYFFRREECVQLRTVLANVSLSDNEHLSSFSKTGTFWDFLTGTGYFWGDQCIDVSAEVGRFSAHPYFNSCLQLIHWRVFKIYKSDPMNLTPVFYVHTKITCSKIISMPSVWLYEF